MRNFLCLAKGVDVIPLLHALARRPDLWGRYPVRFFHEQSIHHGIEDVVLRYNPYAEGEDFLDKVCSSIECENYPPMKDLPEARALVLSVMARVGGERLGRAFISRVAPGKSIGLHSDRIGPAEDAFPGREAPARYYDRYHVVLQSAAGSVFQCGDETVHMASGEVWWFQNELPHAVANNSPIERIHMVVDIHCGRFDYVPGLVSDADV